MIKTHRELADFIAGKPILHMNSLGKDSVVVLEWLANYARPSRVVSVYYSFLSSHPGDAPYLQYLKKRFKGVEFVTRENAIELNQIQAGVFQSPLDVGFYNGFEYEDFSRHKQTDEIKLEFGCEFVAAGFAKYESFARASRFYKEGLVTGDRIYPIGMFSKKQVYEVIQKSGLKLHPVYKFSKSTIDQPSWYKMRSSCIAWPQYEKTVMKWFPLLRLDKYRWERMLNK